MAIRIGINGFGRIGRQVYRAIRECYDTRARMEDINDVFDEMRAGKIDGRIVLEIA